MAGFQPLSLVAILLVYLPLDSSDNSSLLFLLFHGGGPGKCQGECACPFLGCPLFNAVDVEVFGPLWFNGEKILLK